MRFHVLGLPHTVTSKEYNACAYTQKVVKFCKMMTARGHTVIHYGHEESDPICSENVNVLPTEDWKVAYGDHDWRKHFFKYDTNDHAYQTFYRNAIAEIAKRKQPNDFILPFWGAGVRPICDAHPDLITVEPGIGYAGGHWARWKIFESYAIYHAYYGLDAVGTCKQDWYDAVIPNYFDLDDFDYYPNKSDYFLSLGRVYEGKGVHIAIEVTGAIGAKLIVAGQNSLKDMGYSVTPSHVTEFGYADVDQRKMLMSRARAAFIPSMYVEPFGGVQIECLLSGTPTITTDWGSFTENNIHGLTGYRCRTFEQFCWAAKNIDRIKPQNCRDFAEKNFSMERVATMYEEYFQMVLDVHAGGGWYQAHPERTDIAWLKKHIPIPTEHVTDDEFLGAALKKVPQDAEFLVVGAMDGVRHDALSPFIASNTKWSGIMVEPVKDQFDRLVENFANRNNIRFENSAITESSGTAEITRIPTALVGTTLPNWTDGLSTLKKDISIIRDFSEYTVTETVRCITFDQLRVLYEIKNIDILQIDCEGYDYDVFKQIWNQGFRPTVVKVEVNYFTVAELKLFRDLLQDSGYVYRFIKDDIIAVR